MSADDVVVTGIGATTPIGGTAPETWQAMLAGKVGVKNINEPWVEKFGLPVNLHAPMAVDPLDVLPRVEARRLDRSQQAALIAAREAWADAGSPDDIDPIRRGTVIGTGIGGAVTLLDQDDLLETQGIRKVSVMTVPMLMPNGPGRRRRSVEHLPRRGARSGVGLRGRCGRHRLGVQVDQGGRDRHRARRWRGGVHPPTADRRLLPDARDEYPERRTRRPPPARSTPVGTASSSVRAPASWCWSGVRTPRPAAPRSTAPWPASA